MPKGAEERIGGGIEKGGGGGPCEVEEEEEEEVGGVEEGGGGGGIADRGMGGGIALCFSRSRSFSSSFNSSVLADSLAASFTLPPEALISLSIALNAADRLGCGIEADGGGGGGTDLRLSLSLMSSSSLTTSLLSSDSRFGGATATGTGGGMDVPRTESLTTEGRGGGAMGAIDDTTRLVSDELLHSPANGGRR